MLGASQYQHGLVQEGQDKPAEMPLHTGDRQTGLFSIILRKPEYIF